MERIERGVQVSAHVKQELTLHVVNTAGKAGLGANINFICRNLSVYPRVQGVLSRVLGS